MKKEKFKVGDEVIIKDIHSLWYKLEGTLISIDRPFVEIKIKDRRLPYSFKLSQITLKIQEYRIKTTLL